MVDYVRPVSLWQDLPTQSTPIPSPWLTGIDDILADLGAANGRVKTLEAQLAYLYNSYSAPTPALEWFFPISPSSQTVAATLGNNTLRVAPWPVLRTLSIDRIGAEVTVIGDVGSKFRMGIYADDGTGYPGAVVLDAGQIAGDVVAVASVNVSVTLPPALYWIGGVVQSVTTTQPTMRCVANWTPPVIVRQGTSIPGTNATGFGHSHGSVTGALPTPFTTSPGIIGAAPRLIMRAA